MNLPNKLTMLRMALIPFFLFFMLWETGFNVLRYILPLPEMQHEFLWAFVIFAAASITDYLDGNIARKRGLVTNFGKFMDPLADKLLVMAALVSLTQVEQDGMGMPAVVLVLILAREFAVTALRTLAADSGVVIAADKWGKIKTASQMVWICYALLLLDHMTYMNTIADEIYIGMPWMFNLYWAGMAVVVVATVGSGVNYLCKNRQLFMNSK